MEYTKIMGYKISKLTFGTAAIGMKYGISNTPQEPEFKRSLELLKLIRETGINSLDTARTYGIAEKLIGEFLLNKNEAQKIHVVTKFKISSKNIGNKEEARKEAYTSLEASRKSLVINCIPVCLFHMDRHLPVKQVVDILPGIFSDLKSDGWIRLSGISIDHPSELDLFIEQPFAEALQIPINVFDMRLVKNGMLDRLHKYNKLVFARSIFLQGLFFVRPGALKKDMAKAVPFINALNCLAAENNMTTAQLAFTYVRDIAGITSIVFGAVNEMQIRQNIEWLKSKPLDPLLREKIQQMFSNVPEEVITPGLW